MFVHSRALHLFNVHLGTDFFERRHQARRLIDEAVLRSRTLEGPRVVLGDFNEWTRGANKLQRSGAPGVWSVAVPLSPGRHEYAFIINGSRWVADPLAVKSSDDFGTESSVIRVGAPAKSAT